MGKAKSDAEQQLERIRTDPVWFAEEICHIKLDIWQREALEAMGDVVRLHYNRKHGAKYEVKTNPKGLSKFTVRAMHGPGKTFFAALVLIWFHTGFKGLSPATAPSLKQLTKRLWPNIRKIRGGMNEYVKSWFEVKATEVRWHNDRDWGVVAETATQVENIQGYHDDFMLIVVDEASGVKEEMFPAIEGAMSEGVVVLQLLIGNPTKNLGTFYDSHMKPKVAKNYYQIHVNLDKTTRVSRDWVKEMEDKYGKDSPVVAVRCYGEFAEQDENQLIALIWLEMARIATVKSDGSFPKKRISVDVADGGEDFSVLTYAEHYDSYTLFKRQEIYSFPGGTAVDKVVEEVKLWWDKYNMAGEQGDDIVVDSLGVGAGVVSNLVTGGYPVIRYIGGAKSDNTKLYQNRRTQSYLVGRDRLRAERIIFDDGFCAADEDWDDFCAQMCSIRRKVGQERIEDLLSKKEMKEKGIKSPDRADSWKMQFATQSPMLTEFNISQIVLGEMSESTHYDGQLAYH